MTTKPEYRIIRYDGYTSALTKHQLEKTLSALPLSIEIRKGHNLSLTPRIFTQEPWDKPILNAEHDARLIVLKPEPGKRLADACFYGNNRKVFTPSRVMDECTGGGACCSYQFNPKELGLPFEIELTLDIHKFG